MALTRPAAANRIAVKPFGMLNTVRARVCLLLALLTSAGRARATDYYVDQAHASASDLNPGTADQPWKTIAKANQVLLAGDSVSIKAGSYGSHIAPSKSGTSAKPITYRNYGADKVTVSNAAYGILLSGKSFIVVEGIDFYDLDKFLWLENGASHNTIAYCNFDKARTVGWSGSKIYQSSSYNHVHHCRFSKYGLFTTDDIGSVLDIGNENVDTDVTSHNLIENNILFHGGHHVLGIYGMRNVIRNNYLHNENWSNNHGNRVVYLNGYAQTSGWNLIEGNQIAYSGVPPDNAGGAGMSMATSHNIVRKNRYYHNNLAGISMSTTSSYPSSPTYNKIYHNTFFHNGFSTNPDAGKEMLSGIGFARYSGSVIVDNAIKNNLFQSNGVSYGSYQVSLADQVFAGNWEEAGDPMFVNASTTPGDPMNALAPDLHLQIGSPCIDAGGPLTTITSAAGSGTTFQVEDAGYFSDGWGVVSGDRIQILGTTYKVTLIEVDYSTNTLTVDTLVTWQENSGVVLQYDGAGPDLGAHEVQPIEPDDPIDAGSGGTAGAGGSAALDGGSFPNDKSSSADSGCACRSAGAQSAPSWLALLAAVGLWRRRRPLNPCSSECPSYRTRTIAGTPIPECSRARSPRS
jgi:MYXO-CTERM domain-containing protein